MNPSDLREHVQVAILEGDLPLLQHLAESLGASAIRLDEDPQQLTSLHAACAAGDLAMKLVLSAPGQSGLLLMW